MNRFWCRCGAGPRRWLAAAFLLAVPCACSGPARELPEFGRSSREAFARQVLDPDAGRGEVSPPAWPADIASRVYRERYRRSLVEPPERGATVAGELRELR